MAQFLTKSQLAHYDRDGYLVLNQFVSAAECDVLRKRAGELVHEFDPSGVVSIFSTREQTRTSDDYFLTSGDKIRFFFEENDLAAGHFEFKLLNNRS